MHELTIVLNIVELSEDQLKQHDGNKIDAIELEIGSLAGIEMDAFHFAWTAALPGSVLQDSALTIKSMEGAAKCGQCHHEFEVSDHYEPCPRCGSFRSELVQGKELRINSLTIS